VQRQAASSLPITHRLGLSGVGRQQAMPGPPHVPSPQLPSMQLPPLTGRSTTSQVPPIGHADPLPVQTPLVQQPPRAHVPSSQHGCPGSPQVVLVPSQPAVAKTHATRTIARLIGRLWTRLRNRVHRDL